MAFRDRPIASKHVLECGCVGALGMTSFCWLFELLRVTEQHHAVGSLRNRDDIRERHLAGFVDEQDVDRRREFRTRPKPRCPSHDVHFTGLQRREHCLVARQRGNARVLVILRVVTGLVSEANRGVRAVRFIRHGVEKIADDLVTRRHDPDPFSLAPRYAQ